MKKSVLSLAVAAGLTSVMGSAQASMYINPQGTGEALIYPFYSTQNGNDTLITVVNSTDDAKAAKIRILEAENSTEVRDFNIYMSPNDHFSFVLTANEAGGTQLLTGDETCTVPRIPVVDGVRSVDTTNLLYLDDKGADFDNTSISRSRIGYVEVIEMGQIDPDSDTFADLLHGSDGVPADCGELVDRWSVIAGVDGEWVADETDDFETVWNGGGLYGFGQIVNVADGTAFGYDAVAIDALIDTSVTPAPGGAVLHYEPGNTLPALSDSAITSTAIVTVEGESFENTFTAPIFAVNSLFMATEIINDYIVDPVISATTDWVMTFPTKRPHVNGATAPIKPFSSDWETNRRTACEVVGFNFYDREEANPGQPAPGDEPPVFSPSLPPEVVTPDDLALCYETTVVQFGATSALKADTDSVVVGVGPVIADAGYVNGWASLSFDPATVNTAPSDNRVITPAAGGVTQLGLPVTGFAAVTYTNGQLPGGTLANYAIATEHKSSVVTSSI